jgi:hypothetical protein
MEQGFGISTAAVWQSVRRKPPLSIFAERRASQTQHASRPTDVRRRAGDDALPARALDREALQVWETDGGAAVIRPHRGWVSRSLERRSP